MQAPVEEAFICSFFPENRPGFAIGCVNRSCDTLGRWLEGGPYSSFEACEDALPAVQLRAMEVGFAGGAGFGVDDLVVNGQVHFDCGESSSVSESFVDPVFLGAIAEMYPQESGVALGFVTPNSQGSITRPDSGWLVIGLRSDARTGDVDVVPLGLEGWANPTTLEPGTARVFYANEATQVTGSLQLLTHRVDVIGDLASLNLEIDFSNLTVTTLDGLSCSGSGICSVSGQKPIIEPDSEEPAGGSAGSGGGLETGGGCCCDPNTDVCTELVSGDPSDWELACGSNTPGVFTPGSCPARPFSCRNAQTTNELTGAGIVTHIFFPTSICNYQGRNIDTAGTCNTLGGCCQGTHCPSPSGCNQTCN